jgi:hypothetical protein
MILGKAASTAADFEQQVKLREFDLLVRVDGMKVVVTSQTAAEVSVGEEQKVAGEAAGPIVTKVAIKISDQSCV